MYLFVFVPRDSTVTYTFDANSRLCVVLCCVLLYEGVSAELVSNKTMKQAAKRVICGGGLEMQARKRS